MKRAAVKSKIVSEKEDTYSDICFQMWYTIAYFPISTLPMIEV